MSNENKSYTKSDVPKRSVLEEIGNAVSHGIGALLSAAALVLMLVGAKSTAECVGAVIYGTGLFLMFIMSCLYHSFPHGWRVKRLFRRFDYSSIYLLIGATFAPILLAYIGGALGYAFLIVQWSVIVFGITLVSVFSPARFRPLHMALYVILGWSGAMLLPEMLSRGDISFLYYVLGGGIVYSLGIIPFAMRGRAVHFVWHIFVLFGALVQWIGIYTQIYMA